jgi:Bacterial Ig domain
MFLSVNIYFSMVKVYEFSEIKTALQRFFALAHLRYLMVVFGLATLFFTSSGLSLAASAYSINVASALEGATVIASSAAAGFESQYAIDGDRTGAAKSGTVKYWRDNTPGSFPDWLEVRFAGVKNLSSVTVYTLSDVVDPRAGVATAASFTTAGIADFQIQTWDAATGTWLAARNAVNGVVTGNTKVQRIISFAATMTDRMRLVINASPSGSSSVVELEAYTSAVSTSAVSFPFTAVCSLKPCTPPGNIILTATPSDSGVQPATGKLDFSRNGVLIASKTSAPWTYTDSARPAGVYTYTAVWTDVNSIIVVRNSPAQIVTVSSSNVAPTVTTSITCNLQPCINYGNAPGSSNTSTPAPTITIAANAKDEDGSISKVEFYRNNQLIASKTALPWSYADTQLAVGSYTYYVKAFDNGVPALSAQSTPFTLQVTAPNEAANIMVAASCVGANPLNPNACNAPANVTLTSSPIGSDGSIKRVDYYRKVSTLVNGIATTTYTLFASRSAAPWTVTDVGVTPGAYTYAAYANDTGTPTLGTYSLDKAITVADVYTSPNQAPTVSLSLGCAASPCVTPATANVIVAANDPDGSISKVELYKNGVLLATKTSAPWAFADTSLAAGTASYYAKVFDNGTPVLSATSAPQSLTVSAANIAPTVGLTATCAASPCVAPASVNLIATPADADGTISKVEFYKGATLLATKTAAPWTWTDGSVGVGAATYTAKAFDNGSPALSATSSAQAITVQTVNLAPSVSLTATSTATPCSAAASINLVANPVDTDGFISKVEFYRGATLIATKLSAPWTATESDASGGTATYTAKAFDNGNPILSTVSAAAVITVSEAVITGQITIEPGIEGLTTSDNQLSFQGYLSGFPANSAVFINDTLVPLSLDGTFFINDLVLKDGVNTITIKANTVTGSLSKTFTVVSTVNTSYPATLSPHFQLSVLPDKGDAPLASQLIIKRVSSAPFDSITVDYTRDGIVDRVVLPAEFSSNLVSLPLSYATPGLYTLKVVVWQDAAKSIKLHETQRIIAVTNPLDDISHKKQVFQWVVDQLASNAPNQALAAIVPSSVSKYCDTFNYLADRLPAAASNLGTVESVKIGSQTSELIVVRTTNGRRVAYRVYMLQELDGLWRIEDM